jgi:hypothetical protein
LITFILLVLNKYASNDARFACSLSRFGLPENIDYQADAERSKRMKNKKADRTAARIAQARKDYNIN